MEDSFVTANEDEARKTELGLKRDLTIKLPTKQTPEEDSDSENSNPYEQYRSQSMYLQAADASDLFHEVEEKPKKTKRPTAETAMQQLDSEAVLQLGGD